MPKVHTLKLRIPTATDSRVGDEAALEALYTSTGGGSWNTNTGWASSGMSLSDSIHGVTTSTIGGELRVTEIDLKNNNLSGPLPEDLENLKQCSIFDVRQGNFLTGDIPEGLWSMTALTHLKLEGRDDSEPNYTSFGYHPGKTDTATNDFTGTLSSGIGNLTNLKEFWLERQGSMSGSIPSEVGQCTSLEFFSIYGKERDHVTGFTGSVPSEFNNCTNLKFLLIGRNAIGGTLPDLSSTDLRNFWCGGSNISGNIPSSWSALSGMKYFFHDRNGMGGALPSFVFDGSWPALNTFTHVFPEDSNGDAVEGYTGDWGDISWGNVPSVQHLGFSSNALTGTLNSTITSIDPEIFDVPGFEDNVGNNVASGTLPQSGYSNWTNVRYWRLTGTDCTGAIPTGYGSIEELHFSDNEFTSFDSGGDFDLENKNQLESVTVSQNRLTPKDIDPGIGVLPSYSYDNQKPFGDGGSATVGDTLDLSAFDYTDNTYQWQKSSTEGGTYSNLSGETGNTLDTTSHGTGFYKMLIDHPNIAQTFESKPIEVT